MTAWHRGPMLAFDLETTGPEPDTARVVTCTLVELGREGIQRTTEWLVNPGIPIPAGAAEIHGITTERAVEDGQDAEQAIFEIHAQIGLWLGRGRPVVAFNAAYDFTVLDREARRHGIDTLTRRLGDVGPVIDPHVIDKKVDTYRKGKRTLSAVCELYRVDLREAHTSAADALAAARVAFRLAETCPDLLQVPLADLHEAQRGWRFEQCTSLAAYFARQGKPQTVNGGWPVQELPPLWRPDLVDEPAAGVA